MSTQPNGSNPVGQNRTVGDLNETAGSIPCPESAPFFNGNSCINCTEPNPIFNASTRSCTSCQNGFYSVSDANCRRFNATNPNANGNVISPNTTVDPNDNYCPIETPYFNGEQCVACQDQSLPYFNQTSGQCANCPEGTILNNNNGICQNLTPNASNPVAENLTVGQIQTAGPNDIACPVNTPFFINGQCRGCPQNTPFLNASTG